MKKSRYSLSSFKDQRIAELVPKTDHKILAVWAIDCAERVMPYFEEKYPEDPRPRQALETLKTWINTGVFKMAVIRGASLAAHAAARDAGEDNAADAAARLPMPRPGRRHCPCSHSFHGFCYVCLAGQSTGLPTSLRLKLMPQ